MTPRIRSAVLAAATLAAGCAGSPEPAPPRSFAEPVAAPLSAPRLPAALRPPVEGQGMRVDVHTLPTPPTVLRVDANGTVELAQLLTVLGWSQGTPIVVDPNVQERVALSSVLHLPGMASALKNVEIVPID